jgi:hypothetical protein
MTEKFAALKRAQEEDCHLLPCPFCGSAPDRREDFRLPSQPWVFISCGCAPRPHVDGHVLIAAPDGERLLTDAQAQARAHEIAATKWNRRAALSAPAESAAGWQLVPTEPNGKMEEAGKAVGEFHRGSDANDVYRAMLAAAPQPAIAPAAPVAEARASMWAVEVDGKLHAHFCALTQAGAEGLRDSIRNQTAPCDLKPMRVLPLGPIAAPASAGSAEPACSHRNATTTERGHKSCPDCGAQWGVACAPATQEAGPVAWAVLWGVENKRMNSVHIERATAENVAAEIKSCTEVRPLVFGGAAPQAPAAPADPMATHDNETLLDHLSNNRPLNTTQRSALYAIVKAAAPTAPVWRRLGIEEAAPILSGWHESSLTMLRAIESALAAKNGATFNQE